MKKKNKISTNNSNNLFEQLCIERAKKLCNTKKKLYVFWSGTKKSTAVVLSLLKVASPTIKNIDGEHISQLCFIMNQNSLKKDFKTYSKFLNKHPGHNIYTTKITRNLFKNFLIQNQFDPKKDLFVGCSTDLHRLFEKDVDFEKELCYTQSIT